MKPHARLCATLETWSDPARNCGLPGEKPVSLLRGETNEDSLSFASASYLSQTRKQSQPQRQTPFGPTQTETGKLITATLRHT